MSITKKQVVAILEAFAVGDALGMSTEFMTRVEILSTIGAVTDLVDSTLSAHHSDLEKGTITDDTEQTLALLERYILEGVSVNSTLEALLTWIEESDAVAKRFIGPSSLKALQSIKEGSDPREAGKGGTTCGGIMRTLAPVLYAAALGSDRQEMLDMVVIALLPTHYTSQALEAACAYASAVYAALEGDSIDQIVNAAIEGGRYGMLKAPYQSCGASSVARLIFIKEYLKTNPSDEVLLDFLFSVLGTGLESADVFAAVFALFLAHPGDTFKVLCLAASVGGDTDTIAALVGGLSRAYKAESKIPSSIVETVYAVNKLSLDTLAERLAGLRKG
ncbi:MAG: ADP-ribosylglycohydrolase family protein [Sphaerochaeta sp.]|nr:ADP-ribosylglycohydrolase family protein [Sphaerochaeta sp.]